MRLIDADALIERIKYSFYDNERVRIDMVTGTFLTEYCSPTVDAEPVRHGRVIETVENGKFKRIFSCCGTDFTTMTMWMTPRCCPNCGAKMDLEEE